MKLGPQILIVAGEASGDLHGARLLSELHRRLPGLTAFGLGGDELRAAGLEALAHSNEISVVGITEVWKILPRARQIFADLVAAAERRRPDLAVLIDFPDFNLRLARALAERGVRVVYYISPQVWAWRRSRIHTIARVVERVLVLFPFEADLYRSAGVDVVHVGHPLVDEVPEIPNVWARGGGAAEPGSPGPPGPPSPPGSGPYRIALLPGSRRSEVAALLPGMLEAVRLLARELPVEARVIQAATIPDDLVAEAIALAGLPVGVVAADRFQAIADSHLALCASGTATLEVGLLGTPMIVVYRLAVGTYLLARLLVRLPNVSLVNLVLGGRVVPELIQGDAAPENLAREAARLLADRPALDGMRRSLADLRGRLGESGASSRAADEIVALLAPAPGAGAAAAAIPAIVPKAGRAEGAG